MHQSRRFCTPLRRHRPGLRLNLVGWRLFRLCGHVAVPVVLRCLCLVRLGICGVNENLCPSYRPRGYKYLLIIYFPMRGRKNIGLVPVLRKHSPRVENAFSFSCVLDFTCGMLPHPAAKCRTSSAQRRQNAVHQPLSTFSSLRFTAMHYHTCSGHTPTRWHDHCR